MNSASSDTHELFDGKKPVRFSPYLTILSIIAAGLLMLGAWMAFYYAPEERVMGYVQKIFYFHVPAAWAMLLSAPLLAVGAIAYLITRRDGWDRLADAGVELAILFGIMVIISGPLWARKAWGVYWVWDVRLTSTLVMVLTLVACKIVRGYAGPQAKTISAGLSILALLNAIFVWYAVDLWSGSHPPKLVQKLEPRMFQTLWVCVSGFTVTYFTLVWARLRIGKLETAVERLHMNATEAGLDG